MNYQNAVIDAVYKNPSCTLPLHLRSFLVVLAAYGTYTTGRGFSGQERLAQAMGVSSRQVRRYRDELDELIAAGKSPVIVTWKARAKGPGERTSDEYQLEVPGVTNRTFVSASNDESNQTRTSGSSVSNRTSKAVEPDIQGVQTGHGRPVIPVGSHEGTLQAQKEDITSAPPRRAGGAPKGAPSAGGRRQKAQRTSDCPACDEKIQKGDMMRELLIEVLTEPGDEFHDSLGAKLASRWVHADCVAFGCSWQCGTVLGKGDDWFCEDEDDDTTHFPRCAACARKCGGKGVNDFPLKAMGPLAADNQPDIDQEEHRASWASSEAKERAKAKRCA